MSIKTDSLYIDNFPALHAGLVGKNNWQIPVSGQWVPSITGEGATGTWNIDIDGNATSANVATSAKSLQNSTTSITDGKATFSGTTLIKGPFQSKNIYPYLNSNESIPNGNWNLGKKDAIWKGVYCKNLYFLDEENNGTDQESYAYITISSKGVVATEGAEGTVGVAALKLGNSYPAEDILNADGTVKVAAKNGNAKGRIILYNTKNKCVHLEASDGLEQNPTITFPLLSQTLIGTKGSSEIEGQLTPKTTNTYDLGTNQLKWKNIYATTFNGNLVGIADKAKKVSNSLTINNRGKEITFNGEKSATLIVNRRCSVGRSDAFKTNKNAFYTESNQLKSWQKIASIAFQSRYADREIVFKVSKGLRAHQHSGILRAHLRVNASTALADKVQKQLIWEYANIDIDPNNFMLTVAADTTNDKIIGEIWINIGDTSHDIYHFDVMQEHDRSISGNVGYSELWTLYNRDGSKEEDWQYFDLNEMSNKALSVLATIKNNASTASSLSGTRTANTVLAAPNGSNGTATFRKLVAADLPIASATEAGIITTGTQSLAGNKTFTGNLVITKNGGMIKISSKDAYDGDGTTYSVALHVGNNLVSRGLYDVTNNKWMVYKDTEIDVVKTPSLFQAPRIILTNTTDAKLEKYDKVALTIGSSAAQHLEFDNNEIMSKTNASTASILRLNMEGSVWLGKMILQPSNYGILAPTDSNNTKTSSPMNGQIYFQLIE